MTDHLLLAAAACGGGSQGAFDPNGCGEMDDILGVLAWAASAAGVFGLIVVGTRMALQLRRGDPGEGGEHYRGVFFITLGCLLATTAGPLVAALGSLHLLGP